MKVYGVVLPVGTNTPQNIADQFTPEEVKLISLEGLPIWVDHRDRSTADTAYPGIGKIIHDWVAGDGKKYVVGEIRGTTKEEMLTQNRIRHGALKDFSLTHRFELNEHIPTGQLYQTKTPIEVSVCREGRRATCHILDFEEDNASTTKTHNLYNSQCGDPNNFTQRSETLVMSNNAAQVPSNPVPMDIGVVPPLPSQPQLLEELNSLKQQQLQWQTQVASLQAEKQLAQQEKERIQQEQQKLVMKELDSLIDTFLQTTGTKRTEQMTKTLEPITNCRDPAVVNTFKTVMSEAVNANSHYINQVNSLQQQVEAARRGQAASQYWSLTNQQQALQTNKFAEPQTRFTQPPEVNVPQSSGGVFFNPNNGAVTTPVAPVQQPAQAPFQGNPQVPVVTGWSHHNYIPPGYGMPQFQQRQVMDVKAGINHAAPGAMGQYMGEEGFSLDKMAVFNHTTAPDSQSRSNVFGAYDALNRQVQDASKALQTPRGF